ncbi:MAG: tRNA (adenosine(37)-N6)-dimethylallyltransferase MiaA [Gammaproteobacteria bacterium]|nr:tRNA (adenosine(37)-N6)-dimethylallyltransferase MiaA [Gammaproteobacteria bacterium]MDH5629760.1 tRNA (adenosine(37)-N6)-dimethylallyltransferase MiaA [Gammaproteobacteria bacterium]
MSSNSNSAPVVFLMGPTASGKTDLSIELYRTGLFEIISVDSAMIYKGMDIGTAKPGQDELSQTPHHLIDILDPCEAYSASQFSEDARKLIESITQSGKTPLLVGGTMLYFKTLRDGIADLPEADVKVRKKLKDQLDDDGIGNMHKRLAEVDPVAAKRLHHNDTQRIMRALEVFHSTGKPLSLYHQEQSLEALHNPVLSIALAPEDRTRLHQKIAQRFDKMIDNGFLDEVSELYYRDDLSLECPSMKSVGYRQLWQYLDGDFTLEDAIEKSIIATRQLAKRQYTWLRSWEDVHWYDSYVKDQRQAAFDKIVDYVSNR